MEKIKSPIIKWIESDTEFFVFDKDEGKQEGTAE